MACITAVSDWLTGNGEMVRRVRAYDWSASPLGPIEQWPMALRLALGTALDNPLPMARSEEHTSELQSRP